MPTREFYPEFWRDYARLIPRQRLRFRKAVRELIEDLQAKRGFRAGLRVKSVEGHPGVWEMTWAPDGRATFHYGEEIVPGEPHIVWRRIGTHAIFAEP